jgi:hypothetical protein
MDGDEYENLIPILNESYGRIFICMAILIIIYLVKIILLDREYLDKEFILTRGVQFLSAFLIVFLSKMTIIYMITGMWF